MRQQSSSLSSSSVLSTIAVHHSTDDDNDIYTVVPNPVHPLHPLLGRLIYSSSNECLTITTPSTRLSSRILLLGYTTKKNNKSMVGQFGEGLKVGILALLREHRGIYMQTNGGELWKFAFYHDQFFKENLLAVYTANTKDSDTSKSYSPLTEAEYYLLTSLLPSNPEESFTTTTTILTNLPSSLWSAYKEDYLFISPPCPTDYVRTDLGDLLLADKYKSKLYVKSFYIASYEHEFITGVNIKELQIDRDRKAVLSMTDIHKRVANIWSLALVTSPQLVERYVHLLTTASNSADVRLSNHYLTDSVIENIAQTFQSAHPNSVPVINNNLNDVLFLTNTLQLEAVLVPEIFYNLLTRSSRISTIENLRNIHNSSVANNNPSSLTPGQISILTSVVSILNLLDPLFCISDIEVVSFVDNNIWSKANDKNNKIQIDQKAFNRDKIHQIIGNCGLQQRRIEQGKGTIKNNQLSSASPAASDEYIPLSDCSCRETYISTLIIKETKRVHLRSNIEDSRTSLLANNQIINNESTARTINNDKIINHIQQQNVTQSMILLLLERVIRRNERERRRRLQLELERKLNSKQKLLESSNLSNKNSSKINNCEEKEEQPVQDEAFTSSLEKGISDIELNDCPIINEHQLVDGREDKFFSHEMHKSGSDNASLELSYYKGLNLDQLPLPALLEHESSLLDTLKLISLEREIRRDKELLVEKESVNSLKKEKVCFVCFERNIDCIFLPCKHRNVCFICSQRMVKCGSCRSEIKETIQHF